jgi:hypothetical protein
MHGGNLKLAFYSVLLQDTEPDGRLIQRKGVADFGTFIQKKKTPCKMPVQSYSVPHVYSATTSLFHLRLVR